MPVSGEIAAINEELNDFPKRVNTDPYETAWMIKVKPAGSLESESIEP